MTKNKHGRDGLDLVLKVPPGTLVYRKTESGKELASGPGRRWTEGV